MAKIFGNPLDLYTFDSMGQLTTVEDETGVTKLQNNERGLLTRVENPAGDMVQYECIKRTVPLTREHVGLMPKRASTSAAGFLQPGSSTKTGLPRGKAFDFKEEIV